MKWASGFRIRLQRTRGRICLPSLGDLLQQSLVKVFPIRFCLCLEYDAGSINCL